MKYNTSQLSYYGTIPEEVTFDASLDLGFLTKKQYQVLCLRSRGYLQHEVASKLHLSRSSVSMIEIRARKQIEKARSTLKVFELAQRQTRHLVIIEKGVHVQKIPLLVLQEADKYQIHIRQNMIEILRFVRKERGAYISNGRTVRKIAISFNERGKLSLD